MDLESPPPPPRTSALTDVNAPAGGLSGFSFDSERSATIQAHALDFIRLIKAERSDAVKCYVANAERSQSPDFFDTGPTHWCEVGATVRLDRTRAELEEARAENITLRAERARMVKLHVDFEDMRRTVDLITEEHSRRISDAGDQLATAREDSRLLQDELRLLTEDLSVKNDELDKVKKCACEEAERLKEEIQVLTKESEELKAKITKMGEEATTLRDGMRSLEDEVRLKNAVISVKRNEMAQFKTEADKGAARLAQEVRLLTQDLHNATRKKLELKTLADEKISFLECELSSLDIELRIELARRDAAEVSEETERQLKEEVLSLTEALRIKTEEMEAATARLRIMEDIRPLTASKFGGTPETVSASIKSATDSRFPQNPALAFAYPSSNSPPFPSPASASPGSSPRKWKWSTVLQLRDKLASLEHENETLKANYARVMAFENATSSSMTDEPVPASQLSLQTARFGIPTKPDAKRLDDLGKENEAPVNRLNQAATARGNPQLTGLGLVMPANAPKKIALLVPPGPPSKGVPATLDAEDFSRMAWPKKFPVGCSSGTAESTRLIIPSGPTSGHRLEGSSNTSASSSTTESVIWTSNGTVAELSASLPNPRYISTTPSLPTTAALVQLFVSAARSPNFGAMDSSESHDGDVSLFVCPASRQIYRNGLALWSASLMRLYNNEQGRRDYAILQTIISQVDRLWPSEEKTWWKKEAGCREAIASASNTAEVTVVVSEAKRKRSASSREDESAERSALAKKPRMGLGSNTTTP